jgi:serine/threonine protein kinase/pSer/pThr/pTyr-binding forkhead associated (FHA) protein
MRDKSIGELIGRRFRVLEILGHGALGTVYKVLDTRLERFVALKVLSSADSAQAKHFLEEFRASAQLTHPNIVQIYEVGYTGSLVFQTFEYIEGRTLSKFLADGKPLDPDYAIEIIRQVGTGLGYAHEHGVIHRDIKPSNILISNNGRVLLADFGLAIAPGVPTLTQAGTIAGTPAYMSPEQVKGKPVDARSDIFSLGVVFYELLTGRKPFSGESTAKLFSSVVEQEPASPCQINPLVPAPISEIVLRSLAKEPGHRFQTVDDLVRALAGSNLRPRQQEAAVIDETTAIGRGDFGTAHLPVAFEAATPEQAEIRKKLQSLMQASGTQQSMESQELPQRASSERLSSIRVPASAVYASRRPPRLPWLAALAGVFALAFMFWMSNRAHAPGSPGSSLEHSLNVVAALSVGLALWLLWRLYAARRRQAQCGDMSSLTGSLSAQWSDSPVPGRTGQIQPTGLKPMVGQREVEDQEITQAELMPYPPPHASSSEALTHYPSAIAWLLILGGPDRGREIRLGDNVTFGRGTGNDIILHDTQMSRSLAQISLENGRFYISDWSQAGTTYVNRVRIAGGIQELHDRDEIEVGANLFLFVQATSPADLTSEAKRRLREFDEIWDQLTISARHD